MRIEMVFESKFNEGDLVTTPHNDIPRRIIDIKLTSTYYFLYLLEESGVWMRAESLSLVYTAEQQLQMILQQEMEERYRSEF